MTLQVLNQSELGKGAVVVLVAPHHLGHRCHGVAPEPDVGGRLVPPARRQDHMIANSDAFDALTDRPDDARALGTADVELLVLPSSMTSCDDIDRVAERCPHVVVVDTGRHHVNQDLPSTGPRNIDDLSCERRARGAEPVLADYRRVHSVGYNTKRRCLSDVEQCGHVILRSVGCRRSLV